MALPIIPLRSRSFHWKIQLLGGFCLILLAFCSTLVYAFKHHQSPVQFQEYTAQIVQQHKGQGKPFFLLFSAQWCHWCKVFEEKTLSRQRVHSYLNEHFLNVFIDADIHSGAYLKYKAKGVPYTVFLNPDGSLYFKYSGALYEEDFLEVIEGVQENVAASRTLYEEESELQDYQPPSVLKQERLASLPEEFHAGMLDNVDRKEFGLGKGEKAILPATFLYLLRSSSGEEHTEHQRWIRETLRKAIAHIHDPVEGGFFRFAEKRDWQIPHYEKMADLNAGALLLLYTLNQEEPSLELQTAAEQTLHHLTTTLYDPEIGAFLSFQEADPFYYFFNANRRKKNPPPPVIQKGFTDRLAITLRYLIDTLDHSTRFGLQKKITRSLDFLSKMILDQGRIARYYSLESRQWQGTGTLGDHATLAILFSKAAARFKQARYSQAADRVLDSAKVKFYNAETKIFLDPDLEADTNIEYLMEMNSWLVLALMRRDPDNPAIPTILTYFSGMVELLEDRVWGTRDWQFAEHYVPFLFAADQFLNRESAVPSE